MPEPAAGKPSCLPSRLTAGRWRVAWGYAAAVLLLVLARPSPGSILAGLPLVVLGEGLRVLANGALIKDRELTTWGIYSHLRHPLYTGSFLIGLGFIIMAWHLILGAGMLVFFLLLYRRTVVREEEKMAHRFGPAYRDWAERVPRFVPRRFVPAEIAADFRFSRARANREQQGVLGVLAVTMVLWLKYLFFG